MRRSRREDAVATRHACDMYAKQQIRRFVQREASEAAIAAQVQARMHAALAVPLVAHGIAAVPAPTALAVKHEAGLGVLAPAVKHEARVVIDLT